MHKDIEVDKIRVDPERNCRVVTPESVGSLAAQIKRQGLLQNVIVRPYEGDTYQLIAGYRRMTAIKSLIASGDLPANYLVSCTVTNVSDEEADIINGVENIERQDLTLAEEVLWCQRMLGTYSFSPSRLAARLKRSEGWVMTRLKLGALPPEMITLIGSGQLKMSDVTRLYKIYEQTGTSGVWDYVRRKAKVVGKEEKPKASSGRKNRSKKELEDLALELYDLLPSTLPGDTPVPEPVRLALAWAAGNIDGSVFESGMAAYADWLNGVSVS